MKKLWKFLVEAEQWLEILFFTVILFGGGAWCIWEIFIK
jgi:hypothetical protein